MKNSVCFLLPKGRTVHALTPLAPDGPAGVLPVALSALGPEEAVRADRVVPRDDLAVI